MAEGIAMEDQDLQPVAELLEKMDPQDQATALIKMDLQVREILKHGEALLELDDDERDAEMAKWCGGDEMRKAAWGSLVSGFRAAKNAGTRAVESAKSAASTAKVAAPKVGNAVVSAAKQTGKDVVQGYKAADAKAGELGARAGAHVGGRVGEALGRRSSLGGDRGWATGRQMGAAQGRVLGRAGLALGTAAVATHVASPKKKAEKAEGAGDLAKEATIDTHGSAKITNVSMDGNGNVDSMDSYHKRYATGLVSDNVPQLGGSIGSIAAQFAAFQNSAISPQVISTAGGGMTDVTGNGSVNAWRRNLAASQGADTSGIAGRSSNVSEADKRRLGNTVDGARASATKGDG